MIGFWGICKLQFKGNTGKTENFSHYLDSVIFETEKSSVQFGYCIQAVQNQFKVVWVIILTMSN